ncbi:hypothetical protein CANARDRAFT_179379, partial [[Candida] arabinofermentans NRRL YB-2248]
YDMGRTLGTGSFGCVVHGISKYNKRHVAIKILSKNLFRRRKTNISDVLREIKLLSKLNHENIISLIDWYEDDFNFYIITPLARGGELFDRIIELSVFTERDAMLIILKLVKAVKYLHDNGIVHRDIKPENILYMDKNHDNNTIVLADFGLAQQINDPNLKLFGSPGTPTYRAPELFLKTGHNHKVDIWGIGIIAYILLTGRVPVSQDSDLSEFFKLVYSEKFPVFVNGTTPISIESKNFVKACLQPDMDLRPDTNELLRHPWLLGMGDINDTFDLIPAIKVGFNAEKAFRNVIRKVIIEKKLSDLRKLNNEAANE